MQWFESWFDTSYYHTLYGQRDEQEATKFIQNLNNFLNHVKPSKALDLACGKGRHARSLSALGYDVLGVDLSSQSIAFAKQFEQERLRFEVRDIRADHGLEQFDLICSLFTSFGYFDDDDSDLKILNSVYQALKVRGAYVLDFFNANLVYNQIKDHTIEQTNSFDHLRISTKKYIKAGFVYKDIEVIDVEEQNKVQNFQERVKLINSEEFLDLFKKSCFENIQFFGSYKLDEFDRNSSPRCIVIAEKLG